MSVQCQTDQRREAVRRLEGWNGLDYLEVDPSQTRLTVYFLGKLPPELATPKPGLERLLEIQGGHQVTDIRITAVKPVPANQADKDDCLVVTLNKFGDFSTYTLRLVGVRRIDPKYDHLDFSFKIDCPTDLDCAPDCTCPPVATPEPDLNYLAKDYASFRQLILDRLALLVPDWTERHVPDVGITLVELLAYAGDHLSYYQDAVGTEAYLQTARRRVSVRRHARLVDYALSEGCNARTWMCLEVLMDDTLAPGDIAFATNPAELRATAPVILSRDELKKRKGPYHVFQPVVADAKKKIQLRQAHNEIRFYTFGNRECCLPEGSTSAALLDELPAAVDPVPPKSDTPKAADNQPSRALNLHPGDVLIFEEVLGPRTGLKADADPDHRQAVRLTRVVKMEDPVVRTNGRPTRYLQVEWDPEDALSFGLCLSTIGMAPECEYLDPVSVARGNVILVDHGLTVDPEPLDPVPVLNSEACCECEGHPGEVRVIPGKFAPQLKQAPLTFSEPWPSGDPCRCGNGLPSAATSLIQDVRLALPQVWFDSPTGANWQPRPDLLDSGPDDAHFVVEIDTDGVARLRFGDGELGRQPVAGANFAAHYRVGNGAEGNVGRETITSLVYQIQQPKSITRLRNPLPARGGTDAEPMAEAKLFAPFAFKKRLERAITADDYTTLAQRDTKLQRAAAELVWTGSWYEAAVAVDPLGTEQAGRDLLREVDCALYRYRRIGHDLRVVRARYVPVRLVLQICALPGYLRAHVKVELLAVFSNRVLPDGRLGFFHPDNLTFGGGIYLSRIVAAAQAVPGVGSVQVAELHRLFARANHEIENGLLPLRKGEIAQLDNDPVYPERGQLEIRVGGGR